MRKSVARVVARPGLEVPRMDKEEIKGKAEQAKGYVKEKIGQATDNKDLEAEGTGDRAEGQVREAVGKVKDKAKKIAEDIKE